MERLLHKNRVIACIEVTKRIGSLLHSIYKISEWLHTSAGVGYYAATGGIKTFGTVYTGVNSKRVGL